MTLEVVLSQIDLLKLLPHPEKMTEIPPELSSFLRVGDPASLYSLLPTELKRRATNVDPEYFEMPEEELELKVKPPGSLRMLKYRLWDCYTQNMETLQPLSYENICRGVCTPAYLSKAISRNPAVLAWLMTPPRKYEEAAHEALMFGLDRLREVLQFPLWNKEGKPDTKTAGLILSVVKMLDLRVKGSPIQKHEIKQHTLQINASAKDVREISTNTSMDEIERRLRALRGEEDRRELIEEKRPKYELFKTQEIPVEHELLPINPKKKDF
jgi:hypothetical protein